MDTVILSKQLLFASLATGAIYALVALGLNLVYGTMRLLNVAHGEILMLGGYAAYWAMSLHFTNLLAVVIAVPLIAAALGVALYKGIFVWMLGKNQPTQRLESNSLLLFFGISIILQNLTALAFTGTPRGYEVLSKVISIGGFSMTINRLVAGGIALAVVLAIGLFLRFHSFGLSMRALIERREAAVVVGVNVNKVQIVSFALAFGSAALAGVLVSMTEQITPFIGFQFTVAAFVVIILGGLGNIIGGIAASFVLAFVETYGVALTSATWRSILLYGIFVGIILVRPQGLFGKRLLR